MMNSLLNYHQPFIKSGDEEWAIFLKHEQIRLDWKQFYALCDEYHLTRFANVMNDIAVNYLGVTVSNDNIVTKGPYTGKK